MQQTILQKLEDMVSRATPDGLLKAEAMLSPSAESSDKKDAGPATEDREQKTEDRGERGGKPVIVRQESPPPPQQVLRERTFVPYATADPQLKALLWAQEELVRRNPGARTTIDMIEAFADQYQSGMKDQN